MTSAARTTTLSPAAQAAISTAVMCLKGPRDPAEAWTVTSIKLQHLVDTKQLSRHDGVVIIQKFKELPGNSTNNLLLASFLENFSANPRRYRTIKAKLPDFSKLPQTLCTRVFVFLDRKSQVNFRLACSDWNQIATVAVTAVTNTYRRESLSNGVSAKATFAQVLNCEQMGISLSRAFPNLTEISGSAPDLTDGQLRKIATECPLLQQVELTDCIQVTNAGLMELAHCAIQRFALMHNQNVTPEGLVALCKELPHLKGLILGRIFNSVTHREQEIARLNAAFREIATRCPHIDTLAFNSIMMTFPVTDEAISAFAANKKLVRFSLQGNTLVTERGICELLEKSPNLELFSVSQSGFSKAAPSNQTIWRLALHCPKLQRLEVRGGWDVNNKFFDLLFRSCKELSHLTLERTQVSDGLFETISSDANRLETLYVNSCGQITEKGVRFMLTKATASLAPRLSHVTIENCFQITSKAKDALIRDFSGVVDLKIVTPKEHARAKGRDDLVMKSPDASPKHGSLSSLDSPAHAGSQVSA